MTGPRGIPATGTAAELPAEAAAAPAGPAAARAEPAGARAEPAAVRAEPAGEALRPAAGSEPLFGKRWRGPDRPPGRAVLGAAVLGGTGVAALMPPDGAIGVGWPLAAAVLLGAILVGHRTRPSLTAPDTRWAGTRPRLAAPETWWAAGALALTGVFAVRAADWLVALCFFAACGAAALAVAGRGFRGLPSALLAWPVAALRALPWAASGLRGGIGPVARTGAAVLVGVGLLTVFVPLLAAADPAFAQVVDHLIPRWDPEAGVGRVLLFGLAAAAVLGACFLLAAPPAPPGPLRETRLRWLDWALPVGLLVALFALFLAVQSVMLFGGDDYVLATTGLTYAEYARSGFWQLLMVAALTLAVLATGLRWAPEHTHTDRGVKRGLLAALACLALVIVASAIGRMWVYQEAYGFTVLRLVVLTAEAWLGACFILALVAVLRLRPGALTRPVLAAGLLALLALAVLDPDRFIAEANLDRFAATGKIDLDYLGTLSADAVPVLVRLPEPKRACVLAAIDQGPDAEPFDWRRANLSRESAHPVLQAAREACPALRTD